MNEGLPERLRRVLDGFAGQAPLVLGFSGGVDSMVMAEALLRAGLAGRLRLLHVNHGLHRDSDRWAEHCAGYAASRGLAFTQARVEVPRRGNLEEQARILRRRALLQALPDGGLLLLAQHADDQAETLLFRLMRGAGVHGLAAMPLVGYQQGHPVLRPFLPVRRSYLLAQARQWQLDWIEDPGNRDLSFDRNYLRRRVLPLLSRRWPGAVDRLTAAAEHLRETGELLDERAREDYGDCRGSGDYLLLAPFRALSSARRRNLVHWWLRERGLRAPGRRTLLRLEQELLPAGADRQPRVAWAEGCFARFRDRLYLLSARELQTPPEQRLWCPRTQASIAFAAGRLGEGQGEDGDYTLALPASPDCLQVCTARGGERLYYHGMHRRLVELWRERRVPPWHRARLPLFYHQGELIAAAGVGAADDWRADAAGSRRVVCWRP